MPSYGSRRLAAAQCLLALCSALALSGCAAKYAQVPARLNLAPYGRVAIVTFADDQSSSALGPVATQRFAEALLANQSGVELIELGATDPALKALTTADDPAELARVLGERKDVPAVFVGVVKVSSVKPHGQFTGSSVNVRGDVTGELTVRLLSTRTGGTMWRSSAATGGTVGQVHLSNGLPSGSMREKEAVYGDMVQTMVASVTRDLRPTWVKQ